MSAISADYEDLLLGKPDQLDTRAADLVTAADAIEQATAALRGLIDDQTSLSTDALAETASEVARSLSKARTRYRKTGQALQTYAADLRPIQSDARSAISSAEYYEQRSASLPRDISAREGDLLRAQAVDPRLEGRVQSVVTAGSAVDKHASDMDPSIRVTQVNNIWDPVHHLELVGYDPEDDVAGPNWQSTPPSSVASTMPTCTVNWRTMSSRVCAAEMRSFSPTTCPVRMKRCTRWFTAVVEVRRRMAAVVIGAILVVTMTGCGGMNVERVSDRVVQGAGVNGAIVEVQHPGAPWVNKIVIRLFVADPSAEGVASDVRAVAAVAASDADLSDQPLTFIAVEGSPEDFSDPLTATITDSLYIMGSVAGLLGVGSGTEEVLDLSADDVRTLAASS